LSKLIISTVLISFRKAKANLKIFQSIKEIGFMRRPTLPTIGSISDVEKEKIQEDRGSIRLNTIG